MHIVEDIAQTCQRLATLKGGHLIFQGIMIDAIRQAQGKAWIITTSGGKPEGNFTIRKHRILARILTAHDT